MGKLSCEQRIQLLAEVKKQGVPVKEAARTYGISRQAVYKLIQHPPPASGKRSKGRPPLLPDQQIQQLADIIRDNGLHIDEAVDLALLLTREHMKNYLMNRLRRDDGAVIEFSKNRRTTLQDNPDSACSHVLFNRQGFHLSLPMHWSIPSGQEIKDLKKTAEDYIDASEPDSDVNIPREYKKWFFELPDMVWPPGIRKSWKKRGKQQKTGEMLLLKKMKTVASNILNTPADEISFVNSESRGRLAGLDTLIREAILNIPQPDNDADTVDILQGVAFPVIVRNKTFPYMYHEPVPLKGRRSGARGIFLYYPCGTGFPSGDDQ